MKKLLMDTGMDPYSFGKMDRGATSRQKSCNTCVKGKRRCDKRMPRCTRCAAKGLDCLYQKIPPHARQMQDACSEAPAAVAVAAMDVEFDDFNMGGGLHHCGGGGGNGGTTTPAFQMDSDLDFSIMELMSSSSATTASTIASGTDFWDLHGNSPLSFGELNKLEIPPVSMLQPIRDLALVKGIDGCSFDLLDVYDTKTRLGYTVKYIRTMHNEFATTRTLPFLHPRLYGSQTSPKTILSAYMAAASYAGRTEENKLWVMRIVSEMARDVHREGENAVTHMEKLARLQALQVVNAIRVFDGDVSQRAAVEREMTQFLSWLRELVDVKKELEEGLDSKACMTWDRPPKSWEHWILLESTRRTIMIGLAFLCLVYLLKSEDGPYSLIETSTCFTASRHLWQAKSSTEFFSSWKEKPQWCIMGMRFDDVWQYARPDDLDEFSRIMLTVQVGPDLMESFMTGTAC